ncbi:MAG TPA: leucyl aminopeptidase [Thermoanaerobaculia bacterium]
MHIRLSDTVPAGAARRGIAFLHEGADPAAGVPAGARSKVRAAARAAGFEGKEGEIVVEGDWTLCGLGTAPVLASRLRSVLRRALRGALRSPRRDLTLCFDGGVSDGTFRSILPHVALGDYAFERYKSKEGQGRRPRASEKVTATVVPPAGTKARAFGSAVREAEAIASAVAWARDVGNTPGNDLGPAELAREARALAAARGFRLRVLDKREIEKERMGGLLGVNAGSARPPVFLVGEHAPARARGTAVLVGKGITFDSGGISLKPSASMGEMKYDMMGAATVFACLAAARSLELPVRLVALAPVTENMPGGSATRPGDILRMRSGKTVEVDNTDAEGRLVLGDALSYAERFRPDVLIDYATLTGAVVVALGSECGGLMTTDEGLGRQLVEAGEATGERLWPLPLWNEYRENLKSEWADMRNTGGRAAGTINGGIFLKEFAPEGVPWAHLDVAAVAHFEKEQSGWPAGATGFGVALTIEFLKRRFPARKT